MEQATLIKLAGIAYRNIESVVSNVDDDRVWARPVEHAPSWVRDLFYMALEASVDSDASRRYVEEALELISNASDSAELDELPYDWEPDVYNGELLAWLSENLDHAFYADQAVEEMGWPSEGGLYRAIAWGQYEHFREVFATVLEGLRGLEVSDIDLQTYRDVIDAVAGDKGYSNISSEAILAAYEDDCDPDDFDPADYGEAGD